MHRGRVVHKRREGAVPCTVIVQHAGHFPSASLLGLEQRAFVWNELREVQKQMNSWNGGAPFYGTPQWRFVETTVRVAGHGHGPGVVGHDAQCAVAVG